MTDDDYKVCGDGESWRGCGNTGAERRGARTGPGESWQEWFETPCSHCGRVSQDETMVGLPVRVLTSPKPRPAQTFAEVVADAEAYAGNLFREAIEAGSPLPFTEILARASSFAEVRYDQAVEAASAPPANPWTVGTRVVGGETAEDYDTGMVMSVDGAAVTVGWDSGCTTTQHHSVLRADHVTYDGSRSMGFLETQLPCNNALPQRARRPTILIEVELHDCDEYNVSPELAAEQFGAELGQDFDQSHVAYHVHVKPAHPDSPIGQAFLKGLKSKVSPMNRGDFEEAAPSVPEPPPRPKGQS
jgi:hypothetical protein